MTGKERTKSYDNRTSVLQSKSLNFVLTRVKTKSFCSSEAVFSHWPHVSLACANVELFASAPQHSCNTYARINMSGNTGTTSGNGSSRAGCCIRVEITVRDGSKVDRANSGSLNARVTFCVKEVLMVRTSAP